MNSLSLRKEMVLVLLIAIYCAYDLLTSLSTAWGFTTDDAYISWIYARQLIDGHGLLWHETFPPVEGYSNFFWIIISVLVIKLQLPLLTTMKLISCFSLCAGLIFLYRLGRLFFSPLLAILPVFIFSHYFGVVWWTVSGLESMFYCSLSILLIWQCLVALGYQPNEDSEVKKRRVQTSTKGWVLSNISLLLLSLTRFEGLVWTVPVALFLVCQIRYFGIQSFWGKRKIIYLWGLITLLCFVVPYIAYFIWRIAYFGHWIPNSYYCKGLAQGQIFVVNFEYLHIIFPFIIMSLPYFLSSKKDCRHLLLWSPSVIYALLLWKANPVITEYLRLFLGPLALFLLLPVLGVRYFLQYFVSLKWDPKAITILVIIPFTLLFIPGNDQHILNKLMTHYQERTENRKIIAGILNKDAGYGASVLLNDCGLIPFTVRKDIRIIDSQCLNNPELTQDLYKYNQDLYADHLKFDVKPDWVITDYYPLQLHGDYLTLLLEKKKFFDDYQLIVILESGFVDNESSLKSKKLVDFIYRVYKRKKS